MQNKEKLILEITKDQYYEILNCCNLYFINFEYNKFTWLDAVSKVTGIGIEDFPISLEVALKIKN
jgi:hypothetical protein